jgi:hypothetical protein
MSRNWIANWPSQIANYKINKFVAKMFPDVKGSNAKRGQALVAQYAICNLQ